MDRAALGRLRWDAAMVPDYATRRVIERLLDALLAPDPAAARAPWAEAMEAWRAEQARLMQNAYPSVRDLCVHDECRPPGVQPATPPDILSWPCRR